MEKKFAYVFTIIEHERDWGTRPDGYMCFLNKEVADAWRNEEYSSRDSNKVPDCYDSYDNGRWEPVSNSLYEAIELHKCYWTNDLNEEVKPAIIRNINLVWTIPLIDNDTKLTNEELLKKFIRYNKGEIKTYESK